jgi:glucose-6-phosphate dehydrogenase assembly protein OpcA
MQLQTQENTVSLSAAKGIDVGKIEKELAAMWKPADGSKEGSSESGVTRACALNLLVYSSVTDDRTEMEEILDAVCEQHPSRTLWLMADREAVEAKLDAYVSTRCRLLGGGVRQICGEQVTIEAAGGALETVGSAISPLLVPDVPVFLWWKDIPHYEDDLFNRMTAMSDRIVIDSAFFDHPYDDMRRLAQIIREREPLMTVSDLNWGRLTAWRMLMASFWDVPDYLPYLEKIDSITVEYDPPDVAPDQIAPKALLVVGWLASRLGWSFQGKDESEEGASFKLQANGRDLNILMRPSNGEWQVDGMLVSLTMSSTDSDTGFRVSFSEDRKRLETEASIGGARSVGRVLSYEQKTEGQRLSRELTLLQRDVIYEEALTFAVQLIEEI